MMEQAFVVVVNGEQQYSMVPAGGAIPAGWTSTGFEGSHADALAEIGRLAYRPLPEEYLRTIQLSRESAERERAAERARDEERLRILAEMRKQRGE